MIRNLRSLGLALTATLALGAATATAALAEEFSFTSDASHTTLSGTQAGADTITVDAGTLTCETTTYSGTSSEKETQEMALVPHYTACTANPIGSAVVDMNSCSYRFTAKTRPQVEMHIACAEPGDSIIATVSVLGTLKCTVHIPQQALSGIEVEAVYGNDITAELNISSIEYSQTKGSGFGACATAESTTNGTYDGHATIEGGEAALALSPIRHRVQIMTDPVVFKGAGDVVEFKVKNINPDKVPKVEMLAFFGDPTYYKFLAISEGCLDKTKGTHILAKNGDECKEKVECKQKAGQDGEFAAITNPIGGDQVVTKGC